MKKIFSAVIIGLIMLLTIGCSNKEKEIKKETVVISPSSGESFVEAYGTAKALEVNNIYLETVDKVKSIEVKVGQWVQKGEKLIQADKTVITSPYENGVIYEINCRKGDYTNVSMPLLSIANLDSMVVEVNVDQQSIKDIALGYAVKIIPETDKNAAYDGKVTFISSKAVNRNGEATIPVQITMENKNAVIALDSDVQAQITTKTK
jgi:multidrug efflux pump subunit AcrA (membrane-fusion protein)